MYFPGGKILIVSVFSLGRPFGWACPRIACNPGLGAVCDRSGIPPGMPKMVFFVLILQIDLFAADDV